jgi:hypothetical protein
VLTNLIHKESMFVSYWSRDLVHRNMLLQIISLPDIAAAIQDASIRHLIITTQNYIRTVKFYSHGLFIIFSYWLLITTFHCSYYLLLRLILQLSSVVIITIISNDWEWHIVIQLSKQTSGCKLCWLKLTARVHSLLSTVVCFIYSGQTQINASRGWIVTRQWRWCDYAITILRKILLISIITKKIIKI